MNNINFGEDPFYIIFFLLWSTWIFVMALLSTVLDLQCRRNRRMWMEGADLARKTHEKNKLVNPERLTLQCSNKLAAN